MRVWNRIEPKQCSGLARSTLGRSLFRMRADSGRRAPWRPGVLFATCLTVLPSVVTAVPGPMEVLTESGRYVIQYSTDPSPVPRNEMFEMQVSVREPLKKGPAEHISLEVDAGMPGHGHGMNTSPVVKGSPADGFRVHGMCLHMAGDWELTFTVRRGVMSDRGVVQVNVK